MRVSVLGSIFLHVFILLFTVLSLPLFNNNDLEMPPVIQVELIEIAEKTNVPQISKKIEEQKKPVSMLVIGTKASFSKKAKGRIRFSCEQAKDAKDLVQKAISSADGQLHWFTSVGIDESGHEVSRFSFHWSVKIK